MRPKIGRDESYHATRLHAPVRFSKHRAALFKGEMFDDIVGEEILDRVVFYRPRTRRIEIQPGDRADIRYQPPTSGETSADFEPKWPLGAAQFAAKAPFGHGSI